MEVIGVIRNIAEILPVYVERPQQYGGTEITLDTGVKYRAGAVYSVGIRTQSLLFMYTGYQMEKINRNFNDYSKKQL